MDELLKRVNEKRETINQITEEDYKLNMKTFMMKNWDVCQPNTYGNHPIKKIERDSNRMMMEIISGMDIGDAHINMKEFYEIKTSYMGKTGNYTIKNIKNYQNIDYFILILVNKNWRVKCFCVPKDTICDNPVIKLSYQGQTKDRNIQNPNPLYSTTIKDSEVDWLFGKKNVLDGDTYEDLLKYIKKTYLRDKPTVDVPHHNIRVVKGIRSERSKISFNVNGTVIRGSSNKETMLNLVKHIGARNLDGIMWESQFGRHPVGEVNVPLGDGYYFNPKFSLRDIKKVTNRINNKTNYYVTIIEN